SLRDPVQTRVVDGFERAPRGRQRRHLPEQRRLIPQHRDIGDRLAAISEHHRQIDQHPTTVMATTAPFCRRHRHRQRLSQPHRVEVTRPTPATATSIFDIVRSPAGHVAVDASGMLQSFTGEPAEKVGDTFVIHMDRESLNDFPLGKYDVTVHIITFERDREIAWNLGLEIGVPHFYGYRLEPDEDGITNVTSYYDWSKVTGDLKERFPIVPESALRATLGILERTVRKGL